MNKEELEILLNKMYYDYVDREEAQKIIDYINNLEKENQELKRNCNIGNENLNFYREENQQLNKKYENAVADYETIMFENQELKKQLEENKLNHKQLKDLDKIEKSFIELKNQQKEFIEYLERTIEELECDDVDDEEMKGYLIQRIYTFKEVLSKYKEIIGGKE